MAHTFWMVWGEFGSQPRFKHSSKQSAEDEAKRLATNNPGQSFYVLESLSWARRDPPEAQMFKCSPAPLDDLPF